MNIKNQELDIKSNKDIDILDTQYENKNNLRKNLLIGCSGSIAAIRLFEIIKIFSDKFNISIIKV